MLNYIQMSNRPNISATQIAQYIRSKFCKEADCELTPLQLQKLLYYVQGYSLGVLNRPAFFEEIEAWDWGPVINDVYIAYKEVDKDKPIPCDDVETAIIPDEEVLWIIDEVIRNYGEVDGSELSEYTHSETPWQFARATKKRNATIMHQVMREFFSKDALLMRYENYPRPRNRFSLVDLMKLSVGERNAIITDAQREAVRFRKDQGIDDSHDWDKPYWDDE